jgi:hypothetical protein
MTARVPPLAFALVFGTIACSTPPSAPTDLSLSSERRVQGIGGGGGGGVCDLEVGSPTTVEIVTSVGTLSTNTNASYCLDGGLPLPSEFSLAWAHLDLQGSGGLQSGRLLFAFFNADGVDISWLWVVRPNGQSFLIAEDEFFAATYTTTSDSGCSSGVRITATVDTQLENVGRTQMTVTHCVPPQVLT